MGNRNSGGGEEVLKRIESLPLWGLAIDPFGFTLRSLDNNCVQVLSSVKLDRRCYNFKMIQNNIWKFFSPRSLIEQETKTFI